MRRTGIDLSSIRCNVVDAQSSGRRRRGEPAAFRVHQFASITHLDNPQALTDELKALVERGSFSRRAWVNLWDVRSSHQYLLLPSAPEAELESRARHHGASVLGMNDFDVTVSTSIGGTRGEPGHHPKREVSFFAAGSENIRARLRPIVEAGFLVEGVTTPCGALWSQARVRRASVPGQVHAHVALGVSQSALGIFGDGSLLYARDLEWGYGASSEGTTAAQDREILADRLAMELRRSFLYLKQYWEQDVSQVLLCGDMPEIRSLTAPLIERLNIEVETLDTLEGFETSTLPEGFADLASTLRLASSIAVEPPPVNLLPVEVTATRTSNAGLRIVAFGTAAAIAFAAFLYAQAGAARTRDEEELQAVRRELSMLRSQDTIEAAQLASASENAQRAAMDAIDAQGPAMANLLAAVGNAARPDVTLRSLRVFAGSDPRTGAGVRPQGHWHVSVDAIAGGTNQNESRQSADRFLRALSELPEIDQPIDSHVGRFTPSDGSEISVGFRVLR